MMRRICTCCVAVLGLLAFWSCSFKTAGGSSEETNTIAGILVDSNGSPVPNAVVQIQLSSVEATPSILSRSAVSDAVIYVILVQDGFWDTTDAQGRWSVTPVYQGAYTMIAKDSLGRRTIREIEFDDSVRVRDTLRVTKSLDLQLACRFGNARGSTVTIPGTAYAQSADSMGRVHFDSLPQGLFTLMLRSTDPFRYSDQRINIDLRLANVPNVWGPFVDDAFYDSTARAQMLQTVPTFVSDTLWFPLVYAYDVRAWWSFDFLQSVGQIHKFTDVRGRSGDGVVYGGSSAVGLVGNALHLVNGTQFGVIEDAGSVFDSLGAFSVEAWIQVDSLPDSENYQMNLVGQLGLSGALSQDLFSLAIVRDSNDTQAHFAFLLSDGQSGSLGIEDRVVAKEAVVPGVWTYVMASWDNETLCIFVDGKKSLCQGLGERVFAISGEPIYFGKEDLSVVMDEIRIIGINLREADARYRWLRRFP